MGMLNTSSIKTIPAQAGYEVISVEGGGEIGRWPIIAWELVPQYGYGDNGGIQPVALGVIFSADIHAVGLPDGRCIATGGGSPRLWKSAQAWADAVNQAMATHAWHAAGVPVAGEA